MSVPDTNSKVRTNLYGENKAWQGIMGQGWREEFSEKKKSPCKEYRTPKDVSVDWIFQEVGAETELEIQESYGVGGNNFKR